MPLHIPFFGANTSIQPVPAPINATQASATPQTSGEGARPFHQLLARVASDSNFYLSEFPSLSLVGRYLRPPAPRLKLLPSDAQARQEIQRAHDIKLFSDICIVNVDPINDIWSGSAEKLRSNNVADMLDRRDLALRPRLLQEGFDWKAGMKRIASKQGLREMARSIYTNPGTKTPALTTVFTYVAMTATGVENLRHFFGNQVAIKADRFIPCWEDRAGAVQASSRHPSGKCAVTIRINGRSAKFLRPHFQMQGSDHELVFSPLTLFKIDEIQIRPAGRSASAVSLTLSEIRSSKNFASLPW